MKPAAARVALYTGVAAMFAAALRFTPQLPDNRTADMFATQEGEPSWRMHVDTIAPGQSLGVALRRGGLSEDDAGKVLAAAPSLKPRAIQPGTTITVKTDPNDSIPSEISLQLAVDRVLHFKRTGDTWTGTEENIPWNTDTILVAGSISSNLYAAMDASASDQLPTKARHSLTEALASVYDFKIDMSRDLQKGDQFKVMAERAVAPNGTVQIKKVLAATFTLSGVVLQAFRFQSNGAQWSFFDERGKSLNAGFLRAPLEFKYITSSFGMRAHPILGVWKMHKGTDYGASAGTKVRAIGDGVVEEAGWSGGYGNLVQIRHKNGFVTRYGHLSKFAPGIHPGARVVLGQTIAFVGSTGLATGPHLHFEVLVNGVQRDPRTALKRTDGEPIPSTEMASFRVASVQLSSMLDQPMPGAGLAKLAAITK